MQVPAGESKGSSWCTEEKTVALISYSKEKVKIDKNYQSCKIPSRRDIIIFAVYSPVVDSQNELMS